MGSAVSSACPRKIKVMLVDDSAVVRSLIQKHFRDDPEIEICATAIDAVVAYKRLGSVNPDVLLLDVEMPHMDGITFLKKIRRRFPVQVIILSAVLDPHSALALEARRAGAFDIVPKPGGPFSVSDIAGLLRVAVKECAAAHGLPRMLEKKRAAGPVPAHPLILIGSSTGGVEALAKLLPGLAPLGPPILVVQHMPAHFTRSFAARLNSLSRMEVREAAQGDPVRRGLALIAPGDQHMVLEPGDDGEALRVALHRGPSVWHQRPSVDVLFASALPWAGPQMIAILLTGMGCDGAAGMQDLHAGGAHTIAQASRDSVVFGMPRAAIERAAVDLVLPIAEMPAAIRELLGESSPPAAPPL